MARRLAHLVALAATAALGLAAPAGAQAQAPQDPVDPAGGAGYGTAIPGAGPLRPVARRFAVRPARVPAGTLPRVRVRVEQGGARTVRARLVFWPVRGGAVARLDLGRVRTGRTLRPALPEGFRLVPGRYVVRLHARGLGRRTLSRSKAMPGRAPLLVVAPPAPKPVVVPAGDGVFPVRGAWTMPPGGEFGNDRGSHAHEGQDVSAAEGTPVVAPVAGTVAHVAFQAAGAGHYVVLDAAGGRSMFFAHLRAGSIAVTRGQAVAAGAPLGEVGSTGRSSGPHLHFELWEGGWRRGAGSRPVDPLPLLRAWAAGG